jgi:ribosomal protein S18 acetylase RimI-like enzyme
VETITIREARNEDIDEFVKLLMTVFNSKFKVIFGSKINEGQKILSQEMKTRKSLEGNYVATINEQIVGAVVLQTREMKQDFFQTLKLFLTNLSVYQGLRAFIVGGYYQSISGKYISKEGCYFESLFILPEFQKMGIGTKLMEKVEEFAREKNKKFLYSFVRASNIGARNLHKKYGFKEISTKKSILTKIFFGIPKWVYEKKLL